MRIEINQSNKVEQTNKDTIIDVSNKKSFTILISRKIKRKLQEEFRKQGKPRLFTYRKADRAVSFDELKRLTLK